jgi:hypothetical protein
LSAFDPDRLQVAFGGDGVYDFSRSRHERGGGLWFRGGPQGF